MKSTKDDDRIRTLAGKDEEQLLNAFFVFYKTARILDENNDTFKKQRDNFVRCMKNVAKSDPQVTIKLVTGRYFVNELMVAFDENGLSGAASVVSEWKKIGLGGVKFNTEAAAESIGLFFSYLSSLRPDDHNVESISQELSDRDLSVVQLLSLKALVVDTPVVTEEMRREFRNTARKTFFRAMSTVQEIVQNTRSDKEINVAKTKRVVHSLIDQILRDEQSVVELTSIRDYDDYTYAHSINVTIYSLTLGVRLGLDRGRLSQLGFAALFHDVGKVKLPSDLINKPDAYDENDWIQMQRHPMLGAKTILRNMKLQVHTARAARAAFEHHIHSDLTGYPLLQYAKRQPNLFAKIVAVVDTFDALTSGRVYLKKNLGPDKVIKKMRHQMTDKFDPFLLKIFNDIVGIYPAGTLVMLTSDELALILTNNSKEPSRPYIKIVGDRNGLFEEPIWIDLSLPEHADRKIIRRVEPEHYGLNVRDFVLSD